MTGARPRLQLGLHRQRLVPPMLRGRSRGAAWRRLQARRVAAAMMVGAAAYLALGEVLHALQLPTSSVVVAVREVPAGAVVSTGDVALRDQPASSVPERAASDLRVVVGRRVTAPLSPGEVVTQARVTLESGLPGRSGGSRALHVPVADTAGLRWIRPGDHVDVHAGSDGSRVGADLVVLAVDGGDDTGSLTALTTTVGAGRGGALGVVLAVPSEQVPAITRAAYGGTGETGVLLALRSDG